MNTLPKEYALYVQFDTGDSVGITTSGTVLFYPENYRPGMAGEFWEKLAQALPGYLGSMCGQEVSRLRDVLAEVSKELDEARNRAGDMLSRYVQAEAERDKWVERYRGAVAAMLNEQRIAEAAEQREARLRDVVRRIRQWDHLDTAGDGNFWKRELDAALNPEAPAVKDG